MSESSKSLLAYGHAASNFGDLAINQGVLSLLRACQVGPPEKVIGFRLNDDFIMSSIGSMPDINHHIFDVTSDLKKKDFNSERRILAKYLANPSSFGDLIGISDYDLVVLNSGEHLFENGTRSNLFDLIWRILPGIAAAQVGVACIQLPSTFGPFATKLGENIMNCVEGSVTGLAARDAVSLEYVKGMLPNSKIALALDPAFFIEARENPQNSGICNLLGIVLRLEDFGLRAGSKRSSFVAAKHKQTDFQSSQAFRVFRELAVKHLSNGGLVRILVQTSADREISQALVTSLRAEFDESRVELIDPTDLGEYLCELGKLDLMVTSRFHACILSWTQGTPAIGVYSPSHGHKMPGLFDLLDFSDGAHLLGNRVPEVVALEIWNQFNETISDLDKVLNRIDELKQATKTWLIESIANFEHCTFDSNLLLPLLESLVNDASDSAAEQESEFKAINGTLKKLISSVDSIKNGM